MKRADYFALRQQYQPDLAKLVVVAESPPAKGTYFYNADGKSTEHLFSAMMKQVRYEPSSKRDGLEHFRRVGWILVDATYEPINDGYAPRDRNEVIVRDYQLLRSDLKSLTQDRSAPVILIKVNVRQILEPRLLSDGFNVLNRGRPVYFPSHGRQPNFHQQFATILKSEGINP